jgi:hypothetical protein
MKINRLFFLFLALALFVPVSVFAGGVSCTSTTGLVPDGRVLDFDNVQPGSTAYYSFGSVAGRSYSIEVHDDVDSNPGSELQIQYYSQAAQASGWTCANAVAMTAGTPPYSSTQFRDTTAIEPVLVSGRRVSVPAPATDTIIIGVKNTGANSHYVAISVSETTLYNPAVITNGNFNVFYAFQNATSATINGVFTFRETWTGALIAPSPIAVALAPNGSSFNTGTPAAGTNPPGYLALTRGKYGTATFTHDGPPGAFVVDAIIADFSVTPSFIEPTKLAPIRETAH